MNTCHVLPLRKMSAKTSPMQFFPLSRFNRFSVETELDLILPNLTLRLISKTALVTWIHQDISISTVQLYALCFRHILTNLQSSLPLRKVEDFNGLWQPMTT